MKPDLTFDIATAPKRESRVWRQGTVTWGELCGWAATPADEKECGNYVLGVLRETPDPEKGGQLTRRRTKAAVVTRGAVCLDADSAGPTLPDAVAQLGVAALVHTTFSSTPQAPRYRVIVPLSRAVQPDEYHAIAAALMEELGLDQFDLGSVQPERYMFKPSAPNPDTYSFSVVDGPPADADHWLGQWDPDLSQLPAPRPGRNKRDPLELPDYVGAFNRAFSIHEAIEEFGLPYEPFGDDRWHYQGARAQAGLHLVSEALVYSHHMTDPAGGRTCSAFDLVRLHLFGHLDEDARPGTPVNRLPSTGALLAAIAGDKADPRFKRVRDEHRARADSEVRDDFGSADDVDFAQWSDEITEGQSEEAADWRDHLEVNQHGVVIEKSVRNWALIVKHDPAFQSLYFNELTMSIETTGLPWRSIAQGGPVFHAGDKARLLIKLEKEHRFRPSADYVDRWLLDAAHSRYRNPVREYLESLRWDGKRRVETCLPGVRPTLYTRLVARKALVAAVARVLDPGVKWDHTLILYGAEGLGKSWWVQRMAKDKWSATLGRIGDKDTLLTMHRSWIMTADEGFSLRKADSDALKEFLTRTEDVFRAPYEKETLAHKRKCVIWGSTNDEVFLRRQEGNRRFLIIHCEDKVDFDKMTDQYVDQVWAEAVHLYQNGESLFLTDAQAELAAQEREAYVEEDALAGVLEEYLETPVPDSWAEMSPDARVLWLRNRADGMAALGEHQITEVCTTQLWVEALGRRIGEHKRTDLLEIGAALKRVPGWEVVPGRHRTPHYGTQVVFRRVTDPYADIL